MLKLHFINVRKCFVLWPQCSRLKQLCMHEQRKKERGGGWGNADVVKRWLFLRLDIPLFHDNSCSTHPCIWSHLKLRCHSHSCAAIRGLREAVPSPSLWELDCNYGYMVQTCNVLFPSIRSATPSQHKLLIPTCAVLKIICAPAIHTTFWSSYSTFLCI